MTKISENLKDIIQKASTRQVGDTRIDKTGNTLIWSETKPGKFDWRIHKKAGAVGGGKVAVVADGSGDGDGGKHAKLLAHLKKSTSADLKKFAKKPGNDPNLRQTAYDELVERGEDVSDIDLNTGKYGQMKQAFGIGQQKSNFNLDGTGNTSVDDDEEDADWKDPEFIKKKFGFSDWSKASKKQRIAYDNYVTEQKAKDPNYMTPEEEIWDLNSVYAQFLRTDSPLMIASGGAGVGKTYNLHLVAKALNKKPFDPDTDTPGYSDYDYVEAPEITSAPQLASLLKEHNGKTIVFDDTDNLLKTPETFGLLKKATASSGKRIVGKKSTGAANIDPFEFTGKIIFLTNMNQAQLTKDENLSAIYSRALKKDIYFTKKEQLFFIDKLKHKFDFTGLDRLPSKVDDIKERDEVFDLLKDNIEEIDPAKFNVRSMKEMLEMKRASDYAKEYIKNDPVMGKMLFGSGADWKKKVMSSLVKGMYDKKNSIEKAKSILNLD